MHRGGKVLKGSLSSGLKLITAPQTLATFLIGGVALGVLGNAAYQLLTNWLTTSNSAALRIIIGALAVVLGAVWSLGRLAQRLYTAPPLPDKRAPEKRRGIIFLVSNEPTIRKALDWHKETLEWCRLICSEQSLPLAGKLKAEMKERGVDVELVLINDVLDPVECRNIVNNIYSTLPPGLTESDVILDFTGMTSIASVGAVLACLDEQRAIQYTPAVFDPELKAVKPRDPVEIVLNWGALRLSPDSSGQLEDKAEERRQPLADAGTSGS